MISTTENVLQSVRKADQALDNSLRLMSPSLSFLQNVARVSGYASFDVSTNFSFAKIRRKDSVPFSLTYFLTSALVSI